MKITIANTTKIVYLNGIPARIWEGETDSGIPVHAYVTRIAVPEGQDASQFQTELAEQAAPSPEVEAIDLRLLI